MFVFHIFDNVLRNTGKSRMTKKKTFVKSCAGDRFELLLLITFDRLGRTLTLLWYELGFERPEDTEKNIFKYNY